MYCTKCFPCIFSNEPHNSLWGKYYPPLRPGVKCYPYLWQGNCTDSFPLFFLPLLLIIPSFYEASKRTAWLFPPSPLWAVSNSIENPAMRDKMEREVAFCPPNHSWIWNEIQTPKLCPIFSPNQILSVSSSSSSPRPTPQHTHSHIWPSPDPRTLCTPHLAEFLLLPLDSCPCHFNLSRSSSTLKSLPNSTCFLEDVLVPLKSRLIFLLLFLLYPCSGLALHVCLLSEVVIPQMWQSTAYPSLQPFLCLPPAPSQSAHCSTESRSSLHV